MADALRLRQQQGWTAHVVSPSDCEVHIPDSGAQAFVAAPNENGLVHQLLYFWQQTVVQPGECLPWIGAI